VILIAISIAALIAIAMRGSLLGPLPAAELRPLDLPAHDADGDDETAPLAAIPFYGEAIEGDAFFWCLDRSCSMGWDGDLDRLKLELRAAIEALPERCELGLVAFAGGFEAWKPAPVAATPENRAAAIAWVDALRAEGGSILERAAVATVQLSRLSAGARKRIIIVTGHLQDRSEALARITGANLESTPIDGILTEPFLEEMSLLEKLAAMNGGVVRGVEE